MVSTLSDKREFFKNSKKKTIENQKTINGKKLKISRSINESENSFKILSNIIGIINTQ